MDAGISPARQARAQHRHELRTLTYVTLDEANGGIVRNLSHEGVGVQAVAAVRTGQQLRLRFELRYPRLRVETRGEVMWSTHSGQCGIRFLDGSQRLTRQINEWIFGNLLEGMLLHSESTRSIFENASLGARSGDEPRLSNRSFGTKSRDSDGVEQDDGLLISAAPLKVIELPARSEPLAPLHPCEESARSASPAGELDWLSQPLSGRWLALVVNGLVMLAAVLLFALTFLSVTREAPRWPVAMSAGAALVVAALYWGFFRLFGGASPGVRLVRLMGSDSEEDEESQDARFR